MIPNDTAAAVRETHLKDYYRTLRKHRWLVGGLFLATVFTVAIWSFVQTPIYQAAATVLIEPEPPKVLNIQEVTQIGSPTPDYYRTQDELMTSRPIVEKVIENLDLKKRIPGLERAPDPARALQASISVEPRRNTRLVAVKFESPDPRRRGDQRAGPPVHQAQSRRQAARGPGSHDLAQRADERAEVKAQESSEALQNYRVKAGIMGLQEQRQIAAQKIMDFNKQYLEAQAQRLSVEAKLGELQRVTSDRGGAQTIFTVADNPLIQKLKAEASELEVTKAELSRTYKEKHPEILKIDAQLEQVSQKIDAEIKTMMRGVEYFDTTVKTPDDVERYLGLPVIGIVPQFAAKR